MEPGSLVLPVYLAVEPADLNWGNQVFRVSMDTHCISTGYHFFNCKAYSSAPDCKKVFQMFRYVWIPVTEVSKRFGAEIPVGGAIGSQPRIGAPMDYKF